MRLAALVALLLLASVPARADVPPPRDYVETCTTATYAKGGATCLSCQANFGERDRCKQEAPEGYAFRCRTYGASAWSEVWCRGGDEKGAGTPPTADPPAKGEATKDEPAKTTAASATPPPPAHSARGCAVAPARPVARGALTVLLAVLGMALVTRAVRRRA